VNSFFAFLLIFGLGHPTHELIDPAKGVPLHSRIPCDGYSAPEDDVHVQVNFSPGSWSREFVVNRYHTERCDVDVKVRCLHKEKEGWRDLWTASNVQGSSTPVLSIPSCYEWGSNTPVQIVLTGWYKEGAPDSKVLWQQGSLKQVSTVPEVYEFTDPSGGTARLEIRR
jgi:hypothetical protein